jgi:hypothetical protein
MSLHFQLTDQPVFHGLPIMTAVYPCRHDILGFIHDRFADSLSRYCRVFFMRLDVHFPINCSLEDPDRVFRLFISDYARSRRNHGLIHYIWRKQQDHSRYPHFHILLLFDGHQTQIIYGHLKDAEERWARSLGIPTASGLVDYCLPRQGHHLPNGVMLDKRSPAYEQYVAHCFRWASYMGQYRQTDLPLNSRCFGGSTLSDQLAQDTTIV